MTDTSASGRWLILRTSGAKTLPLAQSLAAAGFQAWTPAATVRRRGRKDREAVVPMLPTFVFVREHQLCAIAATAVDPTSRHPAFSLFTRANRLPLVGDSSLNGLRLAEENEAARHQGLLEAEEREQIRRARVEMLRTEDAKRKALRRALRAEHRDLPPGTLVTIADSPALAGLEGEIMQRRGHML